MRWGRALLLAPVLCAGALEEWWVVVKHWPGLFLLGFFVVVFFCWVSCSSSASDALALQCAKVGQIQALLSSARVPSSSSSSLLPCSDSSGWQLSLCTSCRIIRVMQLTWSLGSGGKVLWNRSGDVEAGRVTSCPPPRPVPPSQTLAWNSCKQLEGL